MLPAVERRFGAALKASTTIEWLTDNGSGYIAERTRSFALEPGLKPLTTPVCSPQSKGMAESFVKTMKRDYIAFMPKPDANTAAYNLALAFEHYNETHPHSAVKYRPPERSGVSPFYQPNGDVVSGNIGASPVSSNLLLYLRMKQSNCDLAAITSCLSDRRKRSERATPYP